MSHLTIPSFILVCANFVPTLDSRVAGHCLFVTHPFVGLFGFTFDFSLCRRANGPFRCVISRPACRIGRDNKGELYRARCLFSLFWHCLPFLLSFTKMRFRNVSSKSPFVGSCCCNFRANSWSHVFSRCISMLPCSVLSTCLTVRVACLFFLSSLFMFVLFGPISSRLLYRSGGDNLCRLSLPISILCSSSKLKRQVLWLWLALDTQLAWPFFVWDASWPSTCN
jgi:hypothetical protein